MSNSWKTLADGKIGRGTLEAFRNALTFIPTISHQYDGRFDEAGQKSGGSILIREPNYFTVNDGAALNVDDISEATQTFTVASQKHVDFNWTSVEECLSLDDAMERVFTPAAQTLAQTVEYYILSQIYQDVYNMTGTPANEPSTIAAVSDAASRLSEYLAPTEGRALQLNPTAMGKISQSAYSYFHTNEEVKNALIKNYIGSAATFDWFESTMLPNHTNGTRDDTTPVVNTSSGITSGTDVITMTSFGDGLTYEKGDIFTIADVYAVNPITKARLPFLQQFVVQADETETGTGDMSPQVSPTPYTSGVRQNVELVNAGAGKLVKNLTAGGSGAASTAYKQNLAYHKNAFAVAFAKLTRPSSGECSYTTFDKINLRIWKSSDINSDTHPCRIDVLFGWKTIRPQWACRVRGA